jgi:hypothetical protein
MLIWSNMEQIIELLGYGCYVLNIPKLHLIYNLYIRQVWPEKIAEGIFWALGLHPRTVFTWFIVISCNKHTFVQFSGATSVLFV